MIPQGVKTSESDQKITSNFVEKHIQVGIAALKEIRDEGQSVRHLRWD
jgi:AMP nucleosidase